VSSPHPGAASAPERGTVSVTAAQVARKINRSKLFTDSSIRLVPVESDTDPGSAGCRDIRGGDVVICMEIAGRLAPDLEMRSLRERAADGGAWLVGCVPVLYLALSNGGYDIVERSELGIAVWWIVLVGTLAGALPVAGGTRAGRALFILLIAIAAWTAISLGWTESDERTMIEVGRLSTYVAFFALSLAIQGTGRWQLLVNGATAGIAVVVLMAALSRLQPSWFPAQTAPEVLDAPELARRLAYPLNYSSALAALTALAVPLLLAAASRGRWIVIHSLSAAMVPVALLTLWFTGSSQAIPLLAVALVVYLVLTNDRLMKAGSIVLASVGSAILVSAASSREALSRGVDSALAARQADELIVFVAVVCAGVALAQAGLSLALRYGERPSWLVVSRSGTIAFALTAAVGGLIALGAAAASGTVSDAWDEFKSPPYGPKADGGGQASELIGRGSSGRYQYWEAAMDANATDPLTGIGAGSYEFWWAREGDLPIFIRDAHSLVMDTLAELGWVGFLILMTFLAYLLVTGCRQLTRSPAPTRPVVAAALAACCVFVASVTIDWSWELAALPVAFLLLAPVAISGKGGRTDDSLRSRLVLAGTAILGLVAIAIPLAGSTSVAESQRNAARGEIGVALDETREAAAIEPYASSPRLQEALLLERQGNLGAAIDAADDAVEAEPTNWRVWLVLSRLEARNGDAAAAIRAYREAERLNPRSPLFAR
jgi:hypothetical protein